MVISFLPMCVLGIELRSSDFMTTTSPLALVGFFCCSFCQKVFDNIPFLLLTRTLKFPICQVSNFSLKDSSISSPSSKESNYN